MKIPKFLKITIGDILKLLTNWEVILRSIIGIGLITSMFFKKAWLVLGFIIPIPIYVIILFLVCLYIIRLIFKKSSSVKLLDKAELQSDGYYYELSVKYNNEDYDKYGIVTHGYCKECHSFIKVENDKLKCIGCNKEFDLTHNGKNVDHSDLKLIFKSEVSKQKRGKKHELKNLSYIKIKKRKLEK